MDSTCTTGAWAEVTAVALFLGFNYEVFHNISKHGPHDIVVRHKVTSRLTAIDITLGRWRINANGSKVLTCSAQGKLRSGKKDTVVVVTPEFELFLAAHDKSKGLVYEQVNGYPVVYSIVTNDTFK